MPVSTRSRGFPASIPTPTSLSPPSDKSSSISSSCVKGKPPVVNIVDVQPHPEKRRTRSNGAKRIRLDPDDNLTKTHSTCTLADSWQTRRPITLSLDMSMEGPLKQFASDLSNLKSRPRIWSPNFLFIKDCLGRHKHDTQAMFTRSSKLSIDHLELLIHMAGKTAELPANTALSAFQLCHQFLIRTEKRVCGPMQDAILLASLMLAFKVEEEVDVDVNDVIRKCRLQCTRDQVFKYEGKLCMGLSWFRDFRCFGIEQIIHAVFDSIDHNSRLPFSFKAVLARRMEIDLILNIKVCRERIADLNFLTIGVSAVQAFVKAMRVDVDLSDYLQTSIDAEITDAMFDRFKQ